MKNYTLLFKSLAMIVLIAGTAHLFSFTAKKNSIDPIQEAPSLENPVTSDTPSVLLETDPENKDSIIQNTSNNSQYNQETDYIIGKWKVAYNDKNFKGAIVYDLKKEGKIFNAYTYQYQDEHGNAEKAENIKTLTIKKFDGYQGKGIYKIEYEGKKYDIECQIDIVDENTFSLSYDYYGYSDIETWKRQ
ncbi:hypothetical protein [Aquimarina aquimarini]|uniref:hypothetical protein n=1 Tax=Aquimarina aquimarini TaxID=1191734 RepID=UPI001F46C8C2|nr:hypothetical protein [Aquimarina aquimarini]